METHSPSPIAQERYDDVAQVYYVATLCGSTTWEHDIAKPGTLPSCEECLRLMSRAAEEM